MDTKEEIKDRKEIKRGGGIETEKEVNEKKMNYENKEYNRGRKRKKTRTK